RVRHQHDHLRDRALARAGPQEAVRKLRRRDHRQAEEVAVERQGPVHVAHPQHDLAEVEHRPAHAAAASIIARRFASGACGGTEQPGATRRPRPPSVAAIAARTWAAIASGGPPTSTRRCSSPPITALPLRRRASPSAGLPWLWIE